jgi:hypothetical protein
VGHPNRAAPRAFTETVLRMTAGCTPPPYRMNVKESGAKAWS